MKVLVTGCAGFIGSTLTKHLNQQGHEVLGVDNLNDYYDVELKKNRLKSIESALTEASSAPNLFTFAKQDIAEKEGLLELFRSFKPDSTVHLAAQAGVRYSLENPQAYVDANITGFLNILEACRHEGTKHLVFASSSSVYGANTQMPYSVHHGVNHPVSLYAATKKSNEMMAHSYSHLFHIPCTGLRFFTVYGPWGRPDMAAFIFTRKILSGEPIQVFNEGKHRRDFTYVDDIVQGVYNVLLSPAQPNQGWDSLKPDPASSKAPFKLYNIGNHTPVVLSEFISILEGLIGKKAIIELKGLQAGDVPDTHADVSDLKNNFNFNPNTPLKDGLTHFYNWYKEYYGV